MTLLLVLFVVVKIRFCLFWLFLRLLVFLLVLPHNSKIILKVCIFQGKEVNELSLTDQHPPPFLTAPFMVITYIRFRFPFFMKKKSFRSQLWIACKKKVLTWTTKSTETGTVGFGPRKIWCHTSRLPIFRTVRNRVTASGS